MAVVRVVQVVVENLGDPLEEAIVATFVQEAGATEDQIVQEIDLEVQKEGQDQIDHEDIEDVNSILF